MNKRLITGNKVVSIAFACTLGASTAASQYPAQAAAHSVTTAPIYCTNEISITDEGTWEAEIKQMLDAGDSKGVLKLCDTALQIDPKNQKAWYYRAVAGFMANETLLSVVADLSRALEIDPQYVDALIGRGYINEMLHEYKASLADFSAVLAIEPKHEDALHMKISIHAQLGDTQGLVEDFSHRISVAPEDADAFYYRARCYKMLDKIDLAIADLQKAGELYLAQGRKEDYEQTQSMIASLQTTPPTTG